MELIELQLDWTSLVAIVATGSLFWNIYIGWRDAVRIRLRVRWSYIVYPDGSRHGPYYSFDAANVGRRTVTITAFGFLAGKLMLQINPLGRSELPFELTEGKSKGLQAVPEKVKEGMRGMLKTPPKKACVQDATGRFYTCKLIQSIRDDVWGDASYRPWWRLWEQGWWPV